MRTTTEHEDSAQRPSEPVHEPATAGTRDRVSTPTFRCPRCEADPKVAGLTDRDCAFTADGEFTPKNWNCATIEALFALPTTEAFGQDESMQVINPECYGGWIVLTRYKNRGRTSSAVRVGDFWPPKPLTLADATRRLEGLDWPDDDIAFAD